MNNDLELELIWKIDGAAREEYLKKLKKLMIFSNKNEWSTMETVKIYRTQIGVEQQFRGLSKRSMINLISMYH